MSRASSLDREPVTTTQALSLVPLINELIGEGHILIGEDRISIAPHVCSDRRFQWLVGECRRTNRV